MTFDDVAAEVDQYLEKNGPDIDSPFVVGRFQSVLEEGLYTQKLNSIVAAFQDGHSPDAKETASAEYAILHGSPHATWAIIRRRHKARTISLTPVHTLSAKIDGAPTSVRLMTPDRILQNELFDVQCALTETELIEWRCKEILIKARWTIAEQYIYDDDCIPIILRLNSKVFHNYEWVFDPGSGRPLRHVCVHPGESNIDAILDLLAAVGDQASIQYVLPYAKHEMHFIRWKAISVVAALDKGMGISLLNDAINDVHPDIRVAAHRSLMQPA